jgi:pantothenate kinase
MSDQEEIVKQAKILAAQLTTRAADAARFIVAIAGPPGVGKSTLSRALARQLEGAVVLEADGYHYDNELLDRLDRRSRKGAPDTFDVSGLNETLKRLRSAKEAVIVPRFDRSIDIARAGAVVIDTTTRFVLVEGNYLALREGPWAALADHFDFVVFVSTSMEELERRLVRRWTDLGQSLERARYWVGSNDLPNAATVLGGSGHGNYIIHQMPTPRRRARPV